MSNIPSRYRLSIPTDIQREMSNTSGATECFVEGKFSSLMQKYIVDYSLTVGSSPLLLTDEPIIQRESK